MLQETQFKQQLTSSNYSTKFVDDIDEHMSFMNNSDLRCAEVKLSHQELVNVFGDCYDDIDGFGLWHIKYGVYESYVHVTKLIDDTYLVVSDNDVGDEILQDIVIAVNEE